MKNKINKALIITFIFWLIMFILSVVNILNDFGVLYVIGMCVSALLFNILYIIRKKIEWILCFNKKI